MKATELQCYDLINIDGEPTMVYGVMARMNRVYDTMTNDISMRRCEPIPLLTEILEKNGFVGRGDWAMYFTTEDYDMMWRTDTKPTQHLTIESMTKRIGNFRSYNCNYVHELQHALRLCGLNELADNFRV